MTKKLLETKNWLQDFSNRWERVLTRSTCPSRSSWGRSLQSRKDHERSLEVQSACGHRYISPTEFLDLEIDLEDIQSKCTEARDMYELREKEITDQQSALDKLKQKTNSMQEDYSAVFQELTQQNKYLKESYSKAKESFAIPSILEDYEGQLEYLKSKTKQVENISAQLARVENQNSLNQPRKILKSISSKLKKELNSEREEYKRLFRVHRKLQMSKKCLRNIVSSHIKIQDKCKDTDMNTMNLKDEIFRLNNEIHESIENRKIVMFHIKEQKDLKTTLKDVYSKVKHYRDIADKAVNTIKAMKTDQEDFGLVLLKDLTAELQRLKDVRRVDMCNLLYMKLNAIYQKKKEVVSREICLKDSISRYRSQPASTHTTSINKISTVFSFCKKIN